MKQEQTYERQCREWIEKHPKATAEDAWKAGYFTSVENWTRRKRK